MKKQLAIVALAGVLLFPSLGLAQTQNASTTEQTTQYLIDSLRAELQTLLMDLVHQLQLELAALTERVDAVAPDGDDDDDGGAAQQQQAQSDDDDEVSYEVSVEVLDGEDVASVRMEIDNPAKSALLTYYPTGESNNPTRSGNYFKDGKLIAVFNGVRPELEYEWKLDITTLEGNMVSKSGQFQSKSRALLVSMLSDEIEIMTYLPNSNSFSYDAVILPSVNEPAEVTFYYRSEGVQKQDVRQVENGTELLFEDVSSGLGWSGDLSAQLVSVDASDEDGFVRSIITD